MSISEQREEIRLKLEKNEMERKQILAELQYIQAICRHPNLREWTHHDYGGGVDRHVKCDECGFHKIT